MELIRTPYGSFPVPEGVRMRLETLSDQELINECLDSFNAMAGTAEPFLFNEVVGRCLYPEYEKRLRQKLDRGGCPL